MLYFLHYIKAAPIASSPQANKAQAQRLFDNQRWRRGFAALARLNLSFDLQISWQQLEAGYNFLKNFPETVVVIDHFGFPAANALEVWREGMQKLAQLPNIFVKLSGLAMLNWPAQGLILTDLTNFLLEAFGIERCLFGSNFPVDKLYVSFEQSFSGYQKALAGLSAVELQAVLKTNAERVYRI